MNDWAVMKKIIIYLAAAAVIVSLSVLQSCTKKIHINDVEMRGDTAYYSGKPFTGEIWTDNDADGYFDMADGILKKFTFYHHNGKVAISAVVNNGTKPQITIFDDGGNKISMAEFTSRYSDIWVNMLYLQVQLSNR